MFKIMKDIPGEKETHSVKLVFMDDGEFVPLESSCSCIFGSFYGHSRVNKGKICIHISQALDEYDKEEKERFIKLIEHKQM